MHEERIPGTLNVALTIVVAIACSAALWVASHGSLWQIAAAAIAFSFLNNTMFSLLHESVHGIAHADRRVNEAIGRFAAAFFPTGLTLQRAFHLGHHARNRTIDEQFDYIRPFDRPMLKRAQWYAILTGLYWVFVPLGGIVYLVWPSSFRMLRLQSSATQTGASSIFAGLEDAPSTRIQLELLFTLTMQIALFYALDLHLGGWLLCYGAFALNWSSLQYTDHAFSKLDVRDGAWNLRVNPLTRLLFLNYHHHRAHHQNPHVPWIHLGRFVDPREQRPTFWSIYWKMWRGPRPIEEAHTAPLPAARSEGLLSVSVAFLLLFATCYAGADFLASRTNPQPAWSLPFEHDIPFVPALSILYLTITPSLLLAPFVMRTRNELTPFAIALSIETLIATFFFVLFPQSPPWTRPPVTGWARMPFEIADALNLRYNAFPSLHVAFAVSAAWAFGTRSRQLGKFAWTLWAIAVAISTWLLREHVLADIVAGAVLAVVVMALVHHRFFWVELCCLWQCAQFSRRNIRYFVIFLAIYGPSLLHWRRYRVVRMAFCTAQWIDDLLDGDRASDREPLEVIDELLEQMSRNAFTAEPLSRLCAALFSELSPDARRDFIALVREMRVDRVRMLEKAVWPEEQLRKHHRATFRLSVGLMLALAGRNVRAEEVPSLIDALAWCSTFRDLDEDLRKGLNNIPRGVVVEDWTRASHTRALSTLAQSAREIARLDDPGARKLLGIFQKSIENFARNRGGPHA